MSHNDAYTCLRACTAAHNDATARLPVMSTQCPPKSLLNDPYYCRRFEFVILLFVLPTPWSFQRAFVSSLRFRFISWKQTYNTKYHCRLSPGKFSITFKSDTSKRRKLYNDARQIDDLDAIEIVPMLVCCSWSAAMLEKKLNGQAVRWLDFRL